MRELALARARESRPDSAYLRRGRLACQDQDLFFEMQSYNKFDEHFDTEPEQKPLASCIYPTNGKFMISYPKLTNKPGSGQAKAGRGKPTGVKPDPKQSAPVAEAPRAMTRVEFAAEHEFAAGSEKSLNPEDPDCPRMQNLHLGRTLQDVREQLQEAREEHLAYKAAVLPLLEQYKGEAAKIDPLEKQLEKAKTNISGFVYQIRRLVPFEQEMPVEKAKNAELTQELVTAKARIAELEAGVDPELERLNQETLRLEAALTDSTKTRQELDAATARILELEDDLKKTQVTRDELAETNSVNKTRLRDILAVLDVAVTESPKACKTKMEALKPKMDVWANLNWEKE